MSQKQENKRDDPSLKQETRCSTCVDRRRKFFYSSRSPPATRQPILLRAADLFCFLASKFRLLPNELLFPHFGCATDSSSPSWCGRVCCSHPVVLLFIMMLLFFEKWFQARMSSVSQFMTAGHVTTSSHKSPKFESRLP